MSQSRIPGIVEFLPLRMEEIRRENVMLGQDDAIVHNDLMMICSCTSVDGFIVQTKKLAIQLTMQRLSGLVNQRKSKSNSNDSISTNGNRPRSFLWCWGNLSDRIPAKHKQKTPLLAESLDTERIASITCDSRHIIVVTASGIIYLWELGKSLKKISKKTRYLNLKNRPESLNKLVTMMRNELPIVSNFDSVEQNSESVSNEISLSLNKRIFYGSDAVKWLIDHEAVEDEVESIRFCQALLNEGRMECALQQNKEVLFQNSTNGLYYFCDSKKKIATKYMQKFHAVAADPTLKFSVVCSNQHFFYTITQNGKLYEWDLKQRARDLKNGFIEKRQGQQGADESVLGSDITDGEYEEDTLDDDDDDHSLSDPLDTSISTEVSNRIHSDIQVSKALNEAKVESFPSYSSCDDVQMSKKENELIRDKMMREQQHYEQRRRAEQNYKIDKKKKMQQATKKEAAKWIDPKEFFVGNDDEKLPQMLLLEKLSCRPRLKMSATM